MTSKIKDEHTENQLKQKIQWLFAGAMAGLAVDLSLYPLDTVKTRTQSKAGFKASGGFRQIYKGLPAVAFGSAPGSALFFLTYSSFREFIQHRLASNASPSTDALAAIFGEIAACIARVPMEIVKQRAQTMTNQRIRQIAKEIYKRNESGGGLRGFYRGYASTVCREIPFSFIEFPLWEWLKRRWCRHSGRPECSSIESATFGSLAGLVAAAITTPLDVLKTRIMLDQRGNNSTKLLPLAISIVQQEGILRLYSGTLARSLWMCLGGFIFFFSYEFSMNTANSLH